MLEFRSRHWSRCASGLLARVLHSIFSIVKEQAGQLVNLLNGEFVAGNMDQSLIHQSPINYLVELIGIEPTTSWLQTRRSPKLSYSPAAVH